MEVKIQLSNIRTDGKGYTQYFVGTLGDSQMQLDLFNTRVYVGK